MAWCDYSGELLAIICSRSGFAGILMHVVGPVVTHELERLRCSQRATW